MIYHYTNVKSLLSIMGCNANKSKACPTFRAFDITSCLCQDELRYTFDMLYPMMSRIEEKNKIPSFWRLSRIVSRSRITGYPSENVVDFKKEKDFIPYIVCFSDIPNNDELWKRKDKGEVCIHFEESCLNTNPDNCICFGKHVMYGLDEEQIEKEILKSLEMSKRYLKETSIINEVNENEYKRMFALRYDIYPFIKLNEKKYTDEREYRIVCVVPNREHIKTDDLGRSYFELRTPKSSVKRIEFAQTIPLIQIKEIEKELILSGYTTKIKENSILLS